MSWAGSTRRQRLPPDWQQRRTLVLQRDGHTCQLRYPDICTGRATDVDHKIHGDNHALTNLQAACNPCHQRKTAQEAAAARPRERRTPEPHPGIH